MLSSIFFHPFEWDSDMYIAYLVWAIIIVLLLWLTRLVYKSVRKPQMKHKRRTYDLCRDIFLQITGMEYLIVVMVLFVVYLGLWAFETSPCNADWYAMDTYLIALPQIVLVAVVTTIFFIRYIKFRKPYIK